MVNERQVKVGIQQLIDDFKTNEQEYRKESEASIETKLIEPLFRLLEWTEKDFKKRERTHRGEKRGFADYTFYIGDKQVFFLEVKKIGVPLDKEADAQVVSYALSQSVPIAISTNFEELKVFCVEEESLDKRKMFVFNKPEEFIERFHDLVLLSKSSFEQNLLLRRAESLGLLKRRITIDKPLLDDLMLIREFIADDIEKNYKTKYQPNEKEEIIQRIIDRLIFIRKCEDTGINPENLTLKGSTAVPDNEAYNELKKIFKRYNDVYNSGLFAIDKDNDCDRIEVNGEIVKKLIRYLYISKNEGYVYNFESIPADILGQVYEQYLGKILLLSKTGKAKIANGQAHRKEQGIYYTPTYIVDYIVKNTVGELLKNKKNKAKDLKILDPACGSGSFLIKAFDYLSNDLSDGDKSKQYRIDIQGKYSIKTEILKYNLFGIDLDNKAVEITKLNLLLKAAEKNRRLPEEIDVHIKHGNSLINVESIDQFAFRWERRFQEGSFNAVIGNPPWISFGLRGTGKIDEKEYAYYKNNYFSAEYKMSIYALFIERGIKCLKDGGYFSFILPDSFLLGRYFSRLRKYILDNCVIRVILLTFYDVFNEKATTGRNVIIVLKKETNLAKRKNNIITAIQVMNEDDFRKDKVKKYKYSQKCFNDIPYNRFRLFFDKESKDIVDKMERNSILLNELIETYSGCIGRYGQDSILSDEKKDVLIITDDGNTVYEDYDAKNKWRKVLESGSDISRYSIIYRGKYIYFDNAEERLSIFAKSGFKEENYVNNKLFLRQTGDSLTVAYDDKGYFCINNMHVLNLKSICLAPGGPQEKEKRPAKALR